MGAPAVMTPARWAAVKEVFGAALERDPAGRESFLAEACTGDADLWAEVHSLLTANDQAGSFIETPAAGHLETRSARTSRGPATEPTLPAGARLGPYEVLEPLGTGGMGEVYRARDTRLGREVAVKVLAAHAAGNLNRVRLFQREAVAASALNHPHIVTVHDVGAAGSRPYLTMELLRGRTLREILRGAATPKAELLRLAGRVADGLAAAHAAGIVHRDLKPENVMVTEDGRVKILDFGIAKLDGHHPAETPTAGAAGRAGATSTSIMGTLGYMSPEQARGEVVDFRSDQFSLGAILFEIATGRRAFSAEDTQELFARMLDPAPRLRESLAASLAEVPHELRAVIERCLARERSHRYASTGELACELARLGQGMEEPAAAPAPAAPGPPRLRLVIAGASMLLALLAAGRIDRSRDAPGPGASVAVLPFANVTGDAAREYLSDGVTESLIASVSELPGVRVTARNTVFRYKGRDVDPAEVGRTLHVRAVLLGRVERLAGRVAIHAELVDVETGTRIWGGRVVRAETDLLAMPEEVSRDIARALRLKLQPGQEQRWARSRVQDGEAYRHYLKGRYFANMRTEAGLNKAIESFHQALERDPSQARALAGLADAYVLLSDYAGYPSAEMFGRAREAALRAVEVDETLAEAHTSLGVVRKSYDWDWRAAEREFQRAIEIDPNHATAHHWYGILLGSLGRFEPALAELRLAEQLDPLSLGVSQGLTHVLFWAGRHSEALEQGRRTLELYPEFASAYGVRSWIRLAQGRFPEALAEAREARRLDPVSAPPLAWLGYAAGVAGRTAQARGVLRELTVRRRRDYVSPRDLAALHLALGDSDRALDELERAYRERSGDLADLKVDPHLASLRAHPRFQELLRRVGLAD